MPLQSAPDNLDDAEWTLRLGVLLVFWVVLHLPVSLDLVGFGAPVLAASLVATIRQTESKASFYSRNNN